MSFPCSSHLLQFLLMGFHCLVFFSSLSYSASLTSPLPYLLCVPTLTLRTMSLLLLCVFPWC